MESNEVLAKRIVELTNELSTKNQECLLTVKQVEELRKDLNKAISIILVNNIEIPDGYANQCLADRDADVAAKAYLHALNHFAHNTPVRDYPRLAEGYANRLRVVRDVL